MSMLKTTKGSIANILKPISKNSVKKIGDGNVFDEAIIICKVNMNISKSGIEFFIPRYW